MGPPCLIQDGRLSKTQNKKISNHRKVVKLVLEVIDAEKILEPDLYQS